MLSINMYTYHTQTNKQTDGQIGLTVIITAEICHQNMKSNWFNDFEQLNIKLI